MKTFLFAFLAVVALANATTTYPEDFGNKLLAALFELNDLQPQNNDLEIAVPVEFGQALNDPEAHGWIVNGEAKKMVKSMLAQMPCGWPEYGIPPVAPYRNEEINLAIKKSVVSTLTSLIRFQIEGLNDMKINKLKISYLFTKKVKYNFTFPKIRVSGKYVTDTLINLMKEYGISIRYEGNGDFEFALENLNIAGEFKYKIPLLFGSIKIYKFKIAIALGNCVSHINGLLGNGKINEMINDKIEETVMWGVNGNQAQISSTIENAVVPRVNAYMKGNKIWSLFGMLGGSSSPKCVPPTLEPWY